MLQLERRAGVRKTTLLLLVLLGIVYMVCLRMAPAITMAMTLYLYPMLASVVTMEGSAAGETRRTSEEARWLAYWVLLGAWELLEAVFGAIFFAFPLYRVSKMAAFGYFMAPQTRGAAFVYEQVIRPAAGFVCEHPMVKDAMRQLKKSGSTGGGVTGGANSSGAGKFPVALDKMGTDLKASAEVAGRKVQAAAKEAKID